VVLKSAPFPVPLDETDEKFEIGTWVPRFRPASALPTVISYRFRQNSPFTRDIRCTIVSSTLWIACRPAQASARHFQGDTNNVA